MNEAILKEIKEMLDSEEVPISSLRQKYPGTFFSRCDEREVVEEPYVQNKHYSFYLLYYDAHCIGVTDNLSWANGILIAQRHAA